MLPSDILMAFALEQINPVDDENNTIDDKEFAAAAIIHLWKVSLYVHLVLYQLKCLKTCWWVPVPENYK